MRRLSWCFIGLVPCLAATVACAQSQDPPSRVGRVSVVTGNVSLYPVDGTDWTDASINYPVTSGDAIWADTSARSEIQLGSSAMRIAPLTSLVFGEISDTVTQVRVDQGSIDVHVRYLDDNEVYEIDTPSGVISLLDEGHYRIDVTPDGRRTTVTVRDGSAQVTVGDHDYDVAAGASAVLTDADHPPIMTAAEPTDTWERWADDRASREDAVQSTDFVSRDMVGYEDLDDNGTWQVDASYGPVWIPRTVPAGWAPYRFGHWESVEPWGWTWIDDASWGFAPFHYGRWAYVTGHWGWVPGEIHLRPVYAPALVAFVSDPSWSVSINAGGPGVGWVPLAPGEPYIPEYQASTNYVRRVNASNVDPSRVDYSNLDVTRVRYANRSAPNAVTVVPRNAFIGAAAVARAAVAVRPTALAAARPSAVPTAGGSRIPAPSRPTEISRPGQRQPAHPPRLADSHTPPPAPRQWHPRQANPAPAQATTAPPDRGSARGNPRTPSRPEGPPAQSVTPTPPAEVQPGPPPRAPRPSGPPSPRPTPAPAAPTAAPAAPASRPVAPERNPPVEARPVRPPKPAPAPDNTAEWQQRRAQLVAQQQAEAAQLASKQQAEKQRTAPAKAAQVQKQQQQEQQQMAQRQQKERDQLDKQYRKTGGH